MQFVINIKKKHIFILFLLSLIAGFSIAVVYPNTWVEPNHVVWHDAEDVKVKLKDSGGSESLHSLQYLIDNGIILTSLTGSGGTPIPSPSRRTSFELPKGYETTFTEKNEDFTKVCTLAERNNEGEEINIIRELLNPGKVEKYVKLTDPISLENFDLENGELYEFSCLYGSETTPQINRFVLDENFITIIEATERHVKKKYLLGGYDYEGTDTFSWNVRLNENDELEFIVEMVKSCRQVTDTEQTRTGVIRTTRTVCESTNDCPVYGAEGPLGRNIMIYKWKGISCTIEKI